jgi:hypothetical protein
MEMHVITKSTNLHVYSSFPTLITRLGIIFVYILQLAFALYKISTIIMPPHVKMSIKHDIRELFLIFQLQTSSLSEIMQSCFTNITVTVVCFISLCHVNNNFN